MAGIFEAPRNADTLCELPIPDVYLSGTNASRTQSWVGRKSPVPMSVSRMVCWIESISEVNCADEKNTVLATQAISNVIKSSFGPSGLDKMMVDDIGVCKPWNPAELCGSFLTTLRLLGCYCHERRCYHFVIAGY